MPYFLTKGSFFAEIEKSVRAMDRLQMRKWRDFLMKGDPIPEMDPAQDYEIQVPGAKDHLYRDWLGWEQDQAGNWAKPAMLPAKVGWWVGWRGDPDRILRRTLIEAIEASTGWDDTTGAPTHDPWPIDFIWSCPHPWMEGWVTWSPNDAKKPTGKGRVSVTFATPGNGQGVYQTDIGRPPDSVLPPVTLTAAEMSELHRPIPYAPASKSDKPFGMHVVRSRSHERTGYSWSAPTEFGNLKISLNDQVLDDPAAGVGVWSHAPAYEYGGVQPNHTYP